MEKEESLCLFNDSSEKVIKRKKAGSPFLAGRGGAVKGPGGLAMVWMAAETAIALEKKKNSVVMEIQVEHSNPQPLPLLGIAFATD